MGVRRTGGAFTLVEVLTVVSIIALLVAVMVPSLQQARDLAYRIKCQANQRSIALAMRLYVDSFNGYLPGSPNTSGVGPQQDPPDAAVATNAFDYASPLLCFLNMSVPGNRADRQEVTRLGVFRCPANDQTADPWTEGQYIPDAADFTTFQSASYLTCWQFLLAGDAHASAEAAPDVPYWTTGATWAETLPHRYFPRLSAIGPPSRKIFLADAARFVDHSGKFTYDIGYGFFGAGSYSGSGAWWAGSREYGLNAPASQYSYRHDDGIAAAFYDGHAEYLKRVQSHCAEYWHPSGTVLKDGGESLGGEPSGYVVP